jgi:pyridoxal phosphate enzyme (YggS family)
LRDVPASPTSDLLAANLATIREQIAGACERSGRDPGEIRIVAAAKTVEPPAIERARDAGVREVGENYVQELRAKRGRVDGIVWHFIGTLQSGSAHHVAELADIVETVTPGRASERLGRRATGMGRSIPVLIEVDFTGERTGVAPDALDAAADEVAQTEGVDLVGLMTLPPMPSVAEDSRPFFRRLRELRDGVAAHHPEARELSMGMSLDYPVAVEEGATMVRIGTALFGARRPEEPGRT